MIKVTPDVLAENARFAEFFDGAMKAVAGKANLPMAWFDAEVDSTEAPILLSVQCFSRGLTGRVKATDRGWDVQLDRREFNVAEELVFTSWPTRHEAFNPVEGYVRSYNPVDPHDTVTVFDIDGDLSNASGTLSRLGTFLMKREVERTRRGARSLPHGRERFFSAPMEHWDSEVVQEHLAQSSTYSVSCEKDQRGSNALLIIEQVQDGTVAPVMDVWVEYGDKGVTVHVNGNCERVLSAYLRPDLMIDVSIDPDAANSGEVKYE